MSLLLPGSLLGDGDVVAENHCMQAPADGLTGFSGGEVSRNRDQGKIGVGQRRHGGPQGSRLPIRQFARAALGCGQEFPGFGQSRRRSGIIDRPDSEDQVAAPGGFAVGGEQIGVGHDLPVGRCAHHQGRLFNAVEFGDGS